MMMATSVRMLLSSIMLIESALPLLSMVVMQEYAAIELLSLNPEATNTCRPKATDVHH